MARKYGRKKMKDKEKQIQEIAQIICGRSKDDICIIDNTSCDSSCCWARIAEAIYNVGYRKIDDDCTVITKDELKQYKAQAVNEFAEKVKNKLFEFFQDNEGLDGKISVGVLYVDVIGVEAKDGTIISLGLIDKLLKEYENEKRNN